MIKMKTKLTALAFAIALPLAMTAPSSFAADAGSNVDLVTESRTAQKAEAGHNKQREAGFSQTEQSVQAQLKALENQRRQLESETQKLAADFTENESLLAGLEEKLRLETGSLGELFGVVRQTSRQLQADRVNAPASLGQPEFNRILADMIEAKTLPSLPQLTGLWHGMEQQLGATAGINPLTVAVRDSEGLVENRQVSRIGNIALIDESGYLAWDSKRELAKPFSRQPEGGTDAATLAQLGAGERILLDPTRGAVIAQLALEPTLADRFMQGGLVGKLIAALLASGLGIALVRGGILMKTRMAIKAQIKQPEKPGDNPLGRVLKVYHTAPDRSLESLELRLLEAIVDEQQGCEKGLSMLKLLAALAPMLGLLGTVTGMIETFQVITQYGNGDPKVMAGGISMALVTTVLGLIAAMPLLLAHNILSAQADTIRGTLEKVGISLVAEQSEADHNVNAGSKNANATRTTA